MDLSGPDRDRVGGRGVFYRIPALHSEASGTEGGDQQRGGDRVCVLQRGGVRADGGRGSTAARVVHVLASERAFDAHGGYVLHHLLPGGADAGVSANSVE